MSYIYLPLTTVIICYNIMCAVNGLNNVLSLEGYINAFAYL